MKRADIAKHLHACTQVTRAEIFGAVLDDAKYKPLQYADDAATMFAGYIGPAYPTGGIVFIAFNPGGGGERHHPDDDRFYALLRNFRAAHRQQIKRKFDAINAAFPSVLQRWPIWTIFQPSLAAFGVPLRGVCYFNAVPYRTRGNKKPPVLAKQTAWQQLVAPALAILKPSIMVALGVAAGEVIDRFNEHDAKVYVVPRTNGDSYVSAKAASVLANIRRDFGT